MSAYDDSIMIPLAQGIGVCAFQAIDGHGDLATVVATYETTPEVDRWLHDEDDYVRAAMNVRILCCARRTASQAGYDAGEEVR